VSSVFEVCKNSNCICKKNKTNGYQGYKKSGKLHSDALFPLFLKTGLFLLSERGCSSLWLKHFLEFAWGNPLILLESADKRIHIIEAYAA
jgi:hypothetical protein